MVGVLIPPAMKLGEEGDSASPIDSGWIPGSSYEGLYDRLEDCQTRPGRRAISCFKSALRSDYLMDETVGPDGRKRTSFFRTRLEEQRNALMDLLDRRHAIASDPRLLMAGISFASV